MPKEVFPLSNTITVLSDPMAMKESDNDDGGIDDGNLKVNWSESDSDQAEVDVANDSDSEQHAQAMHDGNSDEIEDKNIDDYDDA